MSVRCLLCDRYVIGLCCVVCCFVSFRLVSFRCVVLLRCCVGVLVCCCCVVGVLCCCVGVLSRCVVLLFVVCVVGFGMLWCWCGLGCVGVCCCGLLIL